MKSPKKFSIHRLLVSVGFCLFAASMVLLIAWQCSIHTSVQQADSFVHTLRLLMPEPEGAVVEERRDNTMATLSLDGSDFVGILEMPRFSSSLPVGADWGKSSRYPCRFTGSVYDRSMEIGATSQTGQYDFYRDISVGDQVFFTDMEGHRYTYTVSDLHYAKHADEAALRRRDDALTIFIQNVYAFEYIIVYCDAA